MCQYGEGDPARGKDNAEQRQEHLDTEQWSPWYALFPDFVVGDICGAVAGSAIIVAGGSASAHALNQRQGRRDQATQTFAHQVPDRNQDTLAQRVTK